MEFTTLESKTEESCDAICDSQINVCPGSTPSVEASEVCDESLPEENAEEESGSSVAESEESDSLIDWGSDSTWADLDIPGDWGTQGLQEKPWDDEKKPYTRFTKYQDLELNEVESKGILTDRIIAASSSYLDRSPETGKYVLCKVDLSRKLLTNISIMTYHHHLQYVDLSWNELTEVEALGQLPFLMYLDVSHNFLTKVLDFKAPFNLTYVNYSYNFIQKIDDLTDFWSIVHFDLSHNHISVIEGLQQLKYLHNLDLSYNAIECIQNLNHMRLLTLNLQHNNIIKFEEGDDVGFKTLIDILRVNLECNHLKTLKLFEGVTAIQSINIANNSISDLMEVTHLRGLNFLTEVNFKGNPITTMKFYMEVCLNTIGHLYVLDGELMDAARKVAVKSSFEPSAYMVAIKKASKFLFLQQINDPMLGPYVVPVDQPPPPIIVLVGPPGSNKGKLVQQFCKQHPRFTILGVSHTTRHKTEKDVEGKTYYFLDGVEFRDMMKDGEFLTVSQVLGHYFGLAQTEISKTTEKRGVLVLHMNLSGALALRARGLRCQLVLAMANTADVHRQWLIEKYYNWHEDAKYIGAVEVENCPEEAMHFLCELEKLSKSNIEEMAKDIVSEMVSNAVKTVDETDECTVTQSYTVDKDSSGSNENRNSVDSVQESLFSTRTSGILKSPSSRTKPVDVPQHPRLSVTFQSQDVQYITENLCLATNLQSNRSVTFSDLQYIETAEHCQSTKYSISGTVIHEYDSGMLSVLSRPNIKNEETVPIVWDIQMEALKTYVDEIIDYREVYLNVHYSNPGLFTEVVFTNDFPEALTKLKQLLKQCIKNQGNAKPHYQFPKDAVYQEMVESRLESLHKDINSELSITQKQDSTKQTPVESFNSKIKKLKKEDVKPVHKRQVHVVDYKLPTARSYSSSIPSNSSDSS